MTLIFKAKTVETINLVGKPTVTKGDVIEVDTKTATWLNETFPSDFEEHKNALVAKNKLLKKTTSFKSK